MTGYENFYRDFPSRCHEILTLTEGIAKSHNREVTLLLMVASSGFVMSFEELESPRNVRSESQSELIDDINIAAWNEIKESYFIGSNLWPERDNSSWLYCNPDHPIGDLENWFGKFPPGPLPRKEGATFNVLKILRNALAHCRIFTMGNPIKKLVFLSRVKKYEPNVLHCLVVGPIDFRKLIDRWCKFLNEFNTDQRTGILKQIAA